MARLTTAMHVSSLVRRANAEGGFGAVLHKGDPTAGAIILILCTRGKIIGCFERVLGETGDYDWRRTGPKDEEIIEKIDEFLNKRKRFDPDIWIVELDVASPDHFIDESFSQH